MPPFGALNSKFTTAAGPVFNTHRGDGFPRIHLDEVPGWISLPETVGGEGVPRVGDVGEDFNPATSIGKTLTFHGRIQAGNGASRSDSEQLASDFAAALWDRSSVQTWLCEPWWSSEQYIFKGRIMSFDGDDKQERDVNAQPSPWQFDFDLNFRMKDGRFYWWNESGTPGDFMTWTNATAVVVQNSGNVPTEPILTVTGVAAGTDVHLIRGVPGGTDLDLWFRQPGAGTLIVDFSVKRAYMNDLLHEVSKTYDELTSTWWDENQVGIPPGIHTISRGPGAGTSIKVDLFSAYI